MGSCRNCKNIQRVVVHPKMRQFIGLWWDDADNRHIQHEVLIFESASRRRTFQQLLRLVDRQNMPRLPGSNAASAQQLGPSRLRMIPELYMRVEVIDSIQETSRKETRDNVSLVNATFVKNSHRGIVGSWRESWSDPSSGEEQAEMLVLTVDTIAIITLESFLKQYAEYHDKIFFNSKHVPDDGVDDTHATDSEGEAISAEVGQTQGQGN